MNTNILMPKCCFFRKFAGPSAHCVSDHPPAAPLSIFSLPVRAREAAPGTSWPKMRHLPLPWSVQIDPWAP